MANSKELRRLKIKKGIRAKISGTSSRPRLSVFRSNTSINAQLIDDLDGKTLITASATDVKEKVSKVEVSKIVGKVLAEKAIQAGITNVVFDRNGYLYHGRVKALAEGAREGGLQF